MEEDQQSLSSHQQSQTGTESKKSLKRSDTLKDDKSSAAMDKKKMKVMKEAIRDFKKKIDELENANKELKATKQSMEAEISDLKSKNAALFEENHKLHDNVIEMHQKISDELMAQPTSPSPHEENFGQAPEPILQLKPSKISFNNVSLLKKSDDAANPFMKDSQKKKEVQGQGSSLGVKPGSTGNLLAPKETFSPAEQHEDDEQQLMEQMRATNMIADSLVKLEAEVKELKSTLEQRDQTIENLNKQLQRHQEEAVALNIDVKHYKVQYEEAHERLLGTDQREALLQEMLEKKQKEMNERFDDIDALKVVVKDRDRQIVELNKKSLAAQDEKLDIEARLEDEQARVHGLREEIVALQDTVKGKDEAIKSLGNTIMTSGKENERLAEMVSQLKNKLVIENVFHTSYAATLRSSSGSTVFAGFKANCDCLIGFVQDQEEEEEFFMEIQQKSDPENIHRIAVDDIDEIEHVEGTLKFYIHFQRKIDRSASTGGLGSMLKKKILGSSPKKKREKYEQCTELFESKFVNKLIENFSSVLEIIEQQEVELNEYVDYRDKQDRRNSYKNKRQVAAPEHDEKHGKGKNVYLVENYMDKVNDEDGSMKKLQAEKKESVPPRKMSHEKKGQESSQGDDSYTYEYDDEYDEEEEPEPAAGKKQ